MRVKGGLAIIAVLAAAFGQAAGAATTRLDQFGTTLVDGGKVFPIVLAKGPEPETETPDGRNGLDEVVEAGVNFFKTGPATRPWWPEDIADAIAYNRAATERGVYTWANLATLSDATPETPVKEQRLRDVIGALEGDWSGRALAMWKGADEPWLAGFDPEELQYAYCVATSRGEPSWCGGRPPADSDHLWVTIQAPRGTVVDLAPYTPVTDIHGVNHYPVTWADRTDPRLHEIGTWTETLASVTPSGAVWTTLQVCASGSNDPDTGEYVLPTARQERYMIYDAILNGARSLAFYGGNIYRCWNERDETLGWNWTFWDTVLEHLVREINASSPIAPALVNPETTRRLSSNDTTTQVISRQGAGESDLWVIAARHGEGSEPVTISGLPSNVTGGTVYTEGRSVEVSDGSLTDTFAQWDVHVYRFAVPPPPPPAAPPPPPPPADPPPPPPVVPASASRVAWCVVPNVKRNTVRQARRALARAGCTAGRVRRARSVRVRKGRVIAQSVRPGRRVPLRTRVGLLVSRGRR